MNIKKLEDEVARLENRVKETEKAKTLDVGAAKNETAKKNITAARDRTLGILNQALTKAQHELKKASDLVSAETVPDTTHDMANVKTAGDEVKPPVGPVKRSGK